MKNRSLTAFTVPGRAALVRGLGLAIVLLCAGLLTPHTARAQVPGIINYQGRIVDAGTNFTGKGQFKFALVNGLSGTTNYWSNDGTAVGQPSVAVSLTVAKGLYSVLLGDTSIANMMTAVTPAVFASSDVRLRVWFNDGASGFQQLSPDQRIGAAGYALVAGIGGAGTNITANDLSLPATTTSSNGVLYVGGVPFLQGYGTFDTFVGSGAGNFSLTGIANTAEGTSALANDTTGGENTANGVSALRFNTTGSYNTAGGASALQNNTSGSYNTANGGIALLSNTSGNDNTADGYGALLGNSSGNGNTANGYEALYSNTTGSGNTADGWEALYANTNGSANTADGQLALGANTSGSQNTANGFSALNENTTGNQNTADGAYALQVNTTGSDNTAEGVDALEDNTTGANNTANGFQALQANTTGGQNTASGYQALDTNTNGTYNTANGFQALASNSSGSENTADGAYALEDNATGSGNIALGYQAGMNLVASGNIDIGNVGAFYDTNIVRIGSSQSQAFLAGSIFGGLGNSIAQSGTAGAVIAGGVSNQIFSSSAYAAIGGGHSNIVWTSASRSVIAGGEGNSTFSQWSVIAGGYDNYIGAGTSGTTIGGGANNTNTGAYATVPGGSGNRALGVYSFAAGQQAQALHQGAFVWADSQNAPFYSSANDQFDIRAQGGVNISGPCNISGACNVTGNLVQNSGTTTVCVLTITGGCDLAEPFAMSTRQVPKGSVVVIDEQHPGHLKQSASAYDKKVAGVVSGANGINTGLTLSQQGITENGQNVALSGRVYAMADTSNGPIQPGDLLTTSDRPGHCMKVTEPGKAQGAIIGKAMTGLTDGPGLVLVLVTLQ